MTPDPHDAAQEDMQTLISRVLAVVNLTWPDGYSPVQYVAIQRLFTTALHAARQAVWLEAAEELRAFMAMNGWPVHGETLSEEFQRRATPTPP